MNAHAVEVEKGSDRTGDQTMAWLGPKRVLQSGGAMAVSGSMLRLVSPSPLLAISGFALIGLGAANIVPILFSAEGRQTVMSPNMAVAAVTTIAYGGVLAGPAALGFIAQDTSLPTGFWLLAALIAPVPVLAGYMSRRIAD